MVLKNISALQGLPTLITEFALPSPITLAVPGVQRGGAAPVFTTLGCVVQAVVHFCGK